MPSDYFIHRSFVTTVGSRPRLITIVTFNDNFIIHVILSLQHYTLGSGDTHEKPLSLMWVHRQKIISIPSLGHGDPLTPQLFCFHLLRYYFFFFLQTNRLRSYYAPQTTRRSSFTAHNGRSLLLEFVHPIVRVLYTMCCQYLTS